MISIHYPVMPTFISIEHMLSILLTFTFSYQQNCNSKYNRKHLLQRTVSNNYNTKITPLEQPAASYLRFIIHCTRTFNLDEILYHPEVSLYILLNKNLARIAKDKKNEVMI